MNQTIIETKEEYLEEPPKNLTAKNVMYYCHHLKCFLPKKAGGEGKAGYKKVERFIEYDCIRYVGDMGEFKDKYSFICLPLNEDTEVFYEKVKFEKRPFEGYYNSRTYTMAVKDGVWSCNCQGYRSIAKKGELPKDGVCCSHLMALFGCFRMKKFGRKS